MPNDAKWKEKYTSPLLISDISKLDKIPDEWAWVSLDTLIVDGPQNGLYLPKSKYGSGIQIIRIDDFQDGFCKPHSELQKVNATKDEINTYQVEAGDLIINRVNSPSHLGKCLVVSSDHIPSLFESNMMKSTISSFVEVDYLDVYIQSKYGKRKLTKNAKWAVNQASINQQDVKSTEVTLPSTEEQKEIVRLVDEKLTASDRLSQELEKKIMKAEKNKQSILAAAFSGKLVPQEKEEPATYLMAAESRSEYGDKRV